eukprot:gene17052-biopygen1266
MQKIQSMQKDVMTLPSCENLKDRGRQQNTEADTGNLEELPDTQKTIEDAEVAEGTEGSASCRRRTKIQASAGVYRRLQKAGRDAGIQEDVERVEDARNPGRPPKAAAQRRMPSKTGKKLKFRKTWRAQKPWHAWKAWKARKARKRYGRPGRQGRLQQAVEYCRRPLKSVEDVEDVEDAGATEATEDA